MRFCVFYIIFVLRYCENFILDMIATYFLFTKKLLKKISNKNVNNKITFIWFIMFPIAVKFENLMKWTFFMKRKFQLRWSNQIKKIVPLNSFCLWCGIFRMWDVWGVRCSGCGMSEMWDVRDVRYCLCGILEISDVGNVGCSGCGVFGMWDICLQNAQRKKFIKEFHKIKITIMKHFMD